MKFWLAGLMVGLGLGMLVTAVLLKNAFPGEVVDRCVKVNGDMRGDMVRQFCQDKFDAVTRTRKE